MSEKQKISGPDRRLVAEIAKHTKQNRSLLKLMLSEINDESIAETIENLLPYLEIVGDALQAIISNLEREDRERYERVKYERKRKARELAHEVTQNTIINPKTYNYETPKES